MNTPPLFHGKPFMRFWIGQVAGTAGFGHYSGGIGTLATKPLGATGFLTCPIVTNATCGKQPRKNSQPAPFRLS